LRFELLGELVDRPAHLAEDPPLLLRALHRCPARVRSGS
jgi:hypothetical protein